MKKVVLAPSFAALRGAGSGGGRQVRRGAIIVAAGDHRGAMICPLEGRNRVPWRDSLAAGWRCGGAAALAQ
jgi:hypothetical protein